jgi:hypothetical protein
MLSLAGAGECIFLRNSENALVRLKSHFDHDQILVSTPSVKCPADRLIAMRAGLARANEQLAMVIGQKRPDE